MATTKTDLPRLAYSLAEAARVLGYDTPKPVEVLVNARKLKAFRINPKADLRVSHAELQRFIAAREEEAESAA